MLRAAWLSLGSGHREQITTSRGVMPVENDWAYVRFQSSFNK